MKVKFYLTTALMIFAALALAACSQEEPMEEIIPVNEGRDITKAIAVIHPTEGNEAHGIVTFTKVDTGIQITADIKGLSPGKHGFHIHEYGDCSAPDATSAGGHFNPDNTEHGAPDDITRHVGDLGNLDAGEDGSAYYERIDTFVSFSGPHSIIGLAVVIHAGEDDFTSQPSGNAGPRVGCGVIGIAE